MSDRARPPRRDPVTERMERDAYVVLQHVFNVSKVDLAADQTDERIAADMSDVRIARDLAFELPHLRLLVDHLSAASYVRCTPDGGVGVTPTGVEYLLNVARQRHSVRWQGHARGAPGLERWTSTWRPAG